MMRSTLSRGAAAVRVLIALYVFALCVDVAAASPSPAPLAIPTRGVGSPQPYPRPHRLARPSRPREDEPEQHRGPGGNNSPPLTDLAPGISQSSTVPPSEATPPPSIPPADAVFSASWGVMPTAVTLGVKTTVTVASPPSASAAANLLLCQTSADEADQMDSTNTWWIMQLVTPEQAGSDETHPVELLLDADTPPASTKNFFLCWAAMVNGAYTCEAYSESFDVTGTPSRRRGGYAAAAREAVRIAPRFQGTPGQIILLTQSQTTMFTVPGTTPQITTPAATSSVMATITISDSTTTWVTDAPTSDPSASPSSKSSSSKLGIGPIVGIAVGGAAVLALLAFLAFACLRRRRNGEARHTLLQEDSGSRDMIAGSPAHAEKHVSVAPAVPMLSFLETRPTSNPNPFDHLELSEPYSGPAGNVPRSVATSANATPAPSVRSDGATLAPGAIGVATSSSAAAAGAATLAAARRSIASTIPEGESPIVPDDMSAVSAPLSPRSTTRSVSAYSVPYSDIPTYGDVSRHTPQLYESPSQTPFLSEPGMSAEELSRLEEEERRIDAAIAEAESHGRR